VNHIENENNIIRRVNKINENKYLNCISNGIKLKIRVGSQLVFQLIKHFLRKVIEKYKLCIELVEHYKRFSSEIFFV